MSEMIVTITGMTCPHCVARAQKALDNLDDVTEAVVTLDPSQALIKGDVASDLVIKAIEDSGYQAEVSS